MKRIFTSSSSRPHILGTGALVLATAQYGLLGIISRYVGYTLPLYYQNWSRCLLATLILAFTVKQWIRVQKKDWKWIALRSAGGMAGFFLFFIAVNSLPVNLTYFIFYGGAILGGYALGYVMFGERVTQLRLSCLLLAMAGLALVYGMSVRISSPLYAASALLAGAGFQVWNAVSKKLHQYQAVQLTFLDNLIASVVYASASLALTEPLPVNYFTPVHLASLLIGVIFVTSALLVIYGFRRIDVQTGSLILLSEILFAILYSFLFYGEIPSATALAGGACIIAAMAIPEINWNMGKRKKT